MQMQPSSLVKLAPAAALILSLAACGAASPLSPLNSALGAARAPSSYSIVYSFQGLPDGYVPASALVSDNSGRLYGVTNYGGVTPRGCNGGTGCGTFFTFDPSSRQETVLYSFGRTRGDGQLPNSLLFFDGSFYGTTEDGGTNASLGTIFKLTPDRKGSNWNETILHRFRGSPNDGASPMHLTIDASGIIYGTAGNGGSATKCFQGCGAVFKLTPPSGKGKWQETILHSFAGAPDGTAPSELILAPDRTLYGETGAGGRSTACGNARGCGTIFALKPSGGSRWTETIVHSYRARGTPKNDGEFPFGGLVLASNGALYGVTAYGGQPRRCYAQGYPWSGCGTFFRLKPTPGKQRAWTESILYLFKGGTSDGARPDSIVLERSGYYGTTVEGGGGYCERAAGCGTLFALVPSQRNMVWTETIAHAFTGGTNDGWDPNGSVVGDRKGLYGVTMYGGSGRCSFGCGTIYEYQPQ
jgi:uncharacterized repeat protein (TIGR03803 family)